MISGKLIQQVRTSCTYISFVDEILLMDDKYLYAKSNQRTINMDAKDTAPDHLLLQLRFGETARTVSKPPLNFRV